MSSEGISLRPERAESFLESVERFAEEQLSGQRGAGSKLDLDTWRRCARFGVQGWPVPDAYGGRGVDPVVVAQALETLGRWCGDTGLLFSLGAQMWASQMALLLFGTDEQRRRYLPGLCDGSLLAAHAASEPGAGSDLLAMSTVAERDGDAWTVTGSKTFVTNAPVADLFVVLATTRLPSDPGSVALFLVDAATEGLHVGPPLRMCGLEGAAIAEVHLEGCRIPYDSVLGALGGLTVFSRIMDWERTMILAPALGAMQREIDMCVRFARSLTTGGDRQRNQALAHRIAEMRVRLDSARLLLHRAAARLQGGGAGLEAAIANFAVAEAFLASSSDAVRIRGISSTAAGTMSEGDLRDALAARLYSGTSEIQLNLIARHMGL